MAGREGRELGELGVAFLAEAGDGAFCVVEGRQDGAGHWKVYQYFEGVQ